MDLINKTLATEFILVGFTNDPKTNAGLFVLFLTIYLITVIGNTFMICIIIISRHLHVPMYFFLCNLAFIDLVYSTNSLPKVLVDLLSSRRVITLLGCGVQVHVGIFLGNLESALLTVMAYDRYNAIRNPLYYPVLMRWSICYGLITFVWIYSFVISVVPGLLQPMRVCYPNIINHISCEVLAVIKLSCDNTQKNELMIFSLSFFSLLVPFFCIIVSYICIICSIGKIHSVGKSKAFSTCSSHVAVVALFYGTKKMHKDLADMKTYPDISPQTSDLILRLQASKAQEASRTAPAINCIQDIDTLKMTCGEDKQYEWTGNLKS
ncbi:TPA: hypothetical protein GDO54_018659 [Pyxicephalus adspersus]|uniref:Olfactory receptor n=1 Tax=Pyxicephalus adspersus TaxID=30357 RepID=A0AAV2ZP50_PYXAD|nr:TPA: hypothetical protein GDO54_018659 [Pyxicephalus adspersus]